MTLKEWKVRHFGQGYEAVAAVDIPGVVRAGQDLYGDCDDLRVCGYRFNPELMAWTVYLEVDAKHVVSRETLHDLLNRLELDSAVIELFMEGIAIGIISGSNQ